MFHSACALVAWATALRVFAGDLRVVVRRLLSLGVRVGSAELSRERRSADRPGRLLDAWWEERR